MASPSRPRPHVRRARLLALGASALLLAGLGFAACSTEDLTNKGGPCMRGSDCAPGLFCVDGLCTDDLSKLDGGSVPNLLDSGAPEATGEAGDGGDAPPPVDSTPVDSTPPKDTGTPPTDTGTPPTDTGTPPTDTGTATDSAGD